jgi:phosphoribosylformylglycinamidine synthase II
MLMAVYRYLVRSNQSNNPRNLRLLADAHALGFTRLTDVQCEDLYFLEGQLQTKEAEQLALRLLTDPVTQKAEWKEITSGGANPPSNSNIVEVALRPGVTDPVAFEIVRAARELGVDGVRAASTGCRYLLLGIDPSMAEELAKRLLANPVIQRWVLGEIEPSFPQEVASCGKVEGIRIRGLDEAGLMEASHSRRAALDLIEMQTIQRYCEREKRDLTDVEFEAIAQTWSEHCIHKTFKGKIMVEDGSGNTDVIDSLFKTFIRATTEEIHAPWILSAFVDNAGVIDLDGKNEVSFKVETHNHPSAIEPFGGANTGVGGVIRDVLGVSHKPVANTDVLCFGLQDASFDELPEGVLHPRRILSGVVAGVQDYGNKIGIPTVNGAILFDPGYMVNPLVFCGTVGIAPKNRHMRSPQAGDRVVILGGRTGRDGLRGATFSSMTMDAQTGEVSGSSVQIGNPIVEKGLVDVLIQARDRNLYTAITDCGAGGLSSAVGEMAARIGADVELSRVRLKYPGLAPWEIWLSEAQERMVLAVSPGCLPELQELCDIYGVELTDSGQFTASGRLIVRYEGGCVLDLDNEFLHAGIPQRQMKAVINKSRQKLNPEPFTKQADSKEILLHLLAHPNIASKAAVIRIYDHEVQGGTVIKPLTGAANDGPSDACVLKPLDASGLEGIVLANGINPEYGKEDAYRMALSVVDEAIRNAVAVGADPRRIALLDNFCWGDPTRPEILGSLVEAARGCRDAALLFQAPFISGKDSLNNEYLGSDGQLHSIPATLLISSIGVMADVTKAVSMDLKQADDLLYLVGDFQPVFGGSHFQLVKAGKVNEDIPDLSPITPKVYQALHEAIKKKIVRACHDLSEGGLAVASAEMCIGGRLGLDIELQAGESLRTLFGETNGCLLVEVAPAHSEKFEAAFFGLPVKKLGLVQTDPRLVIQIKGENSIDLPLHELISSWNTPLQSS